MVEDSEIETFFRRALLQKKVEHQLGFTNDQIVQTKVVSMVG